MYSLSYRCLKNILYLIHHHHTIVALFYYRGAMHRAFDKVFCHAILMVPSKDDRQTISPVQENCGHFTRSLGVLSPFFICQRAIRFYIK